MGTKRGNLSVSHAGYSDAWIKLQQQFAGKRPRIRSSAAEQVSGGDFGGGLKPTAREMMDG